MTDNGTTTLAERPKSKEGLAQLEQVVIRGDLSVLSEAERIGYYARVCDSLGINPLTRPFEYLTLNNRMVLYARKDATDQLRHINGISIDRLERDQTDDMAIVTAYGHDRRKRTDSAIGAVSIRGLAGEALANALMKAETKAKRRMTLSLAGLGWLDESEIGSIEEGQTVSHPMVTSRQEAVAARVAALPEPKETAEYVGETVEPDQIPFEQATRRQGDPWMRMIHAVGAERGLDHDGIHQLAAGKLGVASLNDLTVYQRADLEELLRATQAAEATEVAPVAVEAAAGVTAAGESGAMVDSSIPDSPLAQTFPDSPPARLAPAATDPPSDAVLRQRYAWGEQHGFDDMALDVAAIAAVDVSPLEADAGTWQAFTLLVEAGAIPPPAPAPPKPGSAAYRALSDGLLRSQARDYWQRHGAGT
jgi:hypothetical protein